MSKKNLKRLRCLSSEIYMENFYMKDILKVKLVKVRSINITTI